MLSGAVATQLENFRRHRNLKNLFFPASSDVQAKFAAGRDTAVAILQLDSTEDISISGIESREFEETKAAYA